MFFEEIADLTATHLRTHIGSLLSEIEARHTDVVKLPLPKAIETANLVGGVYNVDVDRTPAVAVDVTAKTFSEKREDGWIYRYDGHIAVIVSAGSEASANKISKRYGAAIELFMRQHQYLHQQTVVAGEATVIEFGFAGVALSGGAKASPDTQQQEIWVAAVRVDAVWVIAENGPGQHA